MTLDTHGRWPWAAVTMAVPATVAVAKAREGGSSSQWLLWAPLPTMFWHQTEEWVRPGGFLPWINRQALESNEDEFPITKRLGFWINVGYGWGAVVLGVPLYHRAPWISGTVFTSLLSNTAMHLSQAVKSKSYNPGLGTGIVVLAPVGIAGVNKLVRDPAVSKRDLALSCLGGVITGLGLFQAMKLRLRKAEKK